MPLFKLLLLGSLPASTLSQKSCHEINPAVTDAWCNSNCNANPPNCPASLCSCAAPGPAPGPSPPGPAPSSCHSLNPAVTDSWCDSNCHATPPMCPATLCSCGAPGPAPGPPGPGPAPLSGNTFGAYFANWAQYHKAPYKHVASDLAPIAGRVDLIYYGFVYFCPPAGTSPMPYWASSPFGSCSDSTEYQLMTVEKNDPASISTMKSLRSGLKVIASIGGWNFPSAYFSKMVSSSETRAKFISGAKTFLSQHGFSGIDIDWEFPCSPARDDPVKITCDKFRHTTDAGGNCPADTTNLVAFLKELRAGLGDSAHITVASQAAEKHWMEMGLKEATPYVDQWNLMSYDYAVPDVPGGATMSPNAPLYTPSSPTAVQMSINYTVQGYLAAGVPASKIMVGIPFYGHTWYAPGLGPAAHIFGLNGSIQGECCGPFKNTYGGKPGQACSQCGVMMYSEILAALGSQTEEGSYHDTQTVSDIAYMAQAGADGGYTAAGTWISYSGSKSIAGITDYVKKNNLAGAFIFDTSMDTLSATATETTLGGFSFKLMNQIADALGKPSQSSGAIYA